MYLAYLRERSATHLADHDILVTWKGILVSLGMGSEFLKTSQAIISLYLPDETCNVHQTQQLADDHKTRTGEIVKCQGGKVLSCSEPSHARAFLQACTALIGLERYEVAQEGYKLSDDQSMIAKCVEKWMEANQSMCQSDIKELLGKDFGHDKFVSISDACVASISYFLLTSECGTTLDISIANDFVKRHLDEVKKVLPQLSTQHISTLDKLDLQELHFCILDRLFEDIARHLGLFGNGGSSEILRCAKSWVSSLRSCKEETKSFRVAECTSSTVLSLSDELCQHLNAIDQILHPIIQPLLSLAMLVVFGHCEGLNLMVAERASSCQLFGRACLLFFEKTALLTDFIELRLYLYMVYFHAWMRFYDNWTDEEIDFLKIFVRRAEACLGQCPPCNARREASVAVNDAKVRLFPDDPDIKIACICDIASIIGKEPQHDAINVVKNAISELKNGQQLRRSLSLAEDLVENIGKIFAVSCNHYMHGLLYFQLRSSTQV